MGLDNIPKNYPCKTLGTAVMVKMKDRDGNVFVDSEGDTHDQIDCEATQEAYGCPWYKNFGKRRADSVGGIFGTSCWYRGKYAYAMLSSLEIGEPEVLYGDAEGEIAPDTLRELAYDMDEAMKDAVTGERQTQIIWEGENVAGQYWYLRDWLIWTADQCEGAMAWY